MYISITKETISSTETFSNLTEMQRRFSKTRNNIKALHKGARSIQKKGIEAWLKSTRAKDSNKNILVELFNK